jgi:hypothetical protein
MGPGVRRDDDLNSIEAVIASEAKQSIEQLGRKKEWIGSLRSQ